MPGALTSGTFIRGLGNLSQATKKASDPLAGLLALRLEGDQVTGLANNAPVATWPNLGTAGAANNAVQATSGLQPHWLSSDTGFNGKPSLILDAVDDGMTTGLNLPNPYTIIFVARAVDLSVVGGNRTLNSEDNNALISICRSSFAIFNGSTVLNSTSANGTAAHIISMAIGAQSKVYIDGVDAGAATGVTADWGRLSIGAVGADGEPCNAAIAAIGAILEVNDTKRQLIESTWKAKYNTP